MKILNLKLKMFKGIREFEVNFNGKSVNIYGDNETGKTTLFDAFNWLLFGKDSLEQSKFDIKTIIDGKPISKAEHSVEAALESETGVVTLKKVYYEKWTKERGAPEAVFSSHTTDYYVDGVPVKEKEYLQQVEALCNQKLFKLISNPLYFNEVLSWQERRQILVNMAGGITDEAIYQADNQLAALKEIIGSRKIDDHKKVLAESRKMINQKIEEIPKRIDENLRMKPDLSVFNFEAIESEKSKIETEIKELQGELVRIDNGSLSVELKRQVAEVEYDILNKRNEYEQQKQNEVSSYIKERDEMRSESQKGYYKRLSVEGELTRSRARKEAIEKEIAELREKYIATHNRTPQLPEIENTCFACGQAIPEEKIKATEEKFLASFNEQRSKELEIIQNKGKALTKENEELTVKMTEIESELKAYDEALTFINAKISDLQGNIDKVLKYREPFEEKEEYKNMSAKRDGLKTQLDNIYQSTLEETEKIKSIIGEKKTAAAALAGKLAQKETSINIDNRVKQLNEELKELSQKWQDSEKELFLVEKFIRLQTSLLEEKINSMFKMANFRMFENQINGGIKEVCEVMYKDVPYSSLNNAARINIGLDVINTISKHNSITAPVWIDNAESVTKYIDTETQVVKLIVSENDKKLRVEA